mgnify:CR=1 FL=1
MATSKDLFLGRQKMGLRTYEVTATQINNEQAEKLIKLIKKVTTLAEQETIITNYVNSL